MRKIKQLAIGLWPWLPYLSACIATTAYLFLPLLKAWWCSITTGGSMWSEGGPACGNNIWMFIATVPTTPLIFLFTMGVAYLLKRFTPFWTAKSDPVPIEDADITTPPQALGTSLPDSNSTNSSGQ